MEFFLIPWSEIGSFFTAPVTWFHNTLTSTVLNAALCRWYTTYIIPHHQHSKHHPVFKIATLVNEKSQKKSNELGLRHLSWCDSNYVTSSSVQTSWTTSLHVFVGLKCMGPACVCVSGRSAAQCVFGGEGIVFREFGGNRRWIKRWISDLLAAAVTLVRWITTSHLWPHLLAPCLTTEVCECVFACV